MTITATHTAIVTYPSLVTNLHNAYFDPLVIDDELTTFCRKLLNNVISKMINTDIITAAVTMITAGGTASTFTYDISTLTPLNAQCIHIV